MAMGLLVFIFLLAGLLTFVGASEECSNRHLVLYRDYESPLAYGLSCTQYDDADHFAACVAQRNSLEKLLGCSNLPRSSVWVATVDRGSKLDLHPRLNNDSPYPESDGTISFTPKNIMEIITDSSRCYYDGLYVAIHGCPFNNLGSFLDCLCCKGVVSSEMDYLQACIHNFIGKGANGRRRGWVPSSLLDNEEKIRDYCRVDCARSPTSISVNSDGEKVNECPSNARLRKGICVQRVVDGRWQSQSPLKIRQDTDDFDDMDDVRIWDLETLDAVPTRTIPTTPATRPTPQSIDDTDYAATLTRSGGQVQSFATYKATGTSGPEDRPGSWAGHLRADPALVVYGLALISIYHVLM